MPISTLSRRHYESGTSCRGRDRTFRIARCAGKRRTRSATAGRLYGTVSRRSGTDRADACNGASPCRFHRPLSGCSRGQRTNRSDRAASCRFHGSVSGSAAGRHRRPVGSGSTPSATGAAGRVWRIGRYRAGHGNARRTADRHDLRQPALRRKRCAAGWTPSRDGRTCTSSSATQERSRNGSEVRRTSTDRATVAAVAEDAFRAADESTARKR